MCNKETSNWPHRLDPHSQALLNVIWDFWNFTGAWTPPQGDDQSPSEEPWGEFRLRWGLSPFSLPPSKGRCQKAEGAEGTLPTESCSLLSQPFFALPHQLVIKTLPCIMGEHLLKCAGSWISRVPSQHQIRPHFQGDVLKILWEHRQKH